VGARSRGVTRRPPNSLCTAVLRTAGYAYVGVLDLSIRDLFHRCVWRWSTARTRQGARLFVQLPHHLDLGLAGRGGGGWRGGGGSKHLQYNSIGVSGGFQEGPYQFNRGFSKLSRGSLPIQLGFQEGFKRVLQEIQYHLERMRV
jgi:hypothetical protein